MDIFTFIFSLVDTLVWPITTLTALFIFIKKGSQIARVIKSIRYKDFELSLREDFAIAQNIIYQIRDDANIEKLPNPPLNELHQLAEIDPSLAILEIWQKLEIKITQLIQHNGLVRFTNPTKFISRLLKLRKINSNEAELFNRLQKIRNSVAHLTPYGHELRPTIAEIVEYRNFVDTFIERLEALRQEDGYIDIH